MLEGDYSSVSMMEDNFEEACESNAPLLHSRGKFAEDVRETSVCEDVVDETEISPSHIEWSEDEEKRLVRKIDMVVLSLLILGFLALQYDRGNIGNALTDYFLEDVGITQNEFNIGQQLLSFGIVALEIPSNLILFRLGPRAWIGCQMLAWGLVSTLQAFQKGLGAFLFTRLLLGLCESGFIPAGLYTITIWYKRDETSKRFSWFFIGNMAAAATTGLVAYGVLQMRGIANLAGWQWLFVIEGLFTMLVGLLFLALFPKEPGQPVSFLDIRFFNERETAILVQRVLQDDPSKLQKRKKVSRVEIVSALSNWRIYPHLLLTITASAPTSTLASYAPTLVTSFGYGRLKSNALVSVGNWIAVLLNLTLGTLADKTRNRGLWVLTGLLMWWASSLGCLVLTDSTSASKRYAVLVLALSSAGIWHPTNGSWLALNSRSAGERSITMAMFIMAANTSGIIGSQLFRSEDAPRYHVGWSAIVGLISAGVIFCVVANAQYWWFNRRWRNKIASGNGGVHRLYQM